MLKEVDITGIMQRLRRLAEHVWRHFREDRCFEESASLSFTSLLALVPLLAVVFGVATVFPVFDKWAEQLQDFVFRNFVPASGAQIQTYLSGFLESVGSLTLPGLILLIVTALMLMMRIERAFNRIWRVPVARSLVNRIVMYWAVLTLGPLALGATAALSAQHLFSSIESSVSTAGFLQQLGIFVLTWLTFTLTFAVVPNRSVKLVHAASGGFVSAVLFSLAKTGFVIFVGRASFNILYGTLATIPIFLFWIYLVWTVVLLGASLAAALTTFKERRSDWSWPWQWEFLLAYRLLAYLWEAQRDGRKMSEEDLLNCERGVNDSLLQQQLEIFLNAGLVTCDTQDQWMLIRDLEHFSLLDLYLAGRFHLPVAQETAIPVSSRWDAGFLEALQPGAILLQQPLKPMYQLVIQPDGKPE